MKCAHVTMLCAALALAIALSVRADVPRLIDFQGRVTNSGGSPVADSTYELTFRVYSDSVTGIQLWQETQDVAVSKGLFTVLLGGTQAWPDSFFAANPNLFITVEMTSAPGESTPRIRLTSTPFTFHALTADALTSPAPGNGWVDDGAIVRLADSADYVGMGTNSPSHKLSVVAGSNAIYGEVTGGPIGQIGVLGKAVSSGGEGVRGISEGADGRGLYGRVFGDDAFGVYGRASGTTGTGVYGEVDATTTGVGVHGKAISTGSEGVRGISEGTEGRGVYGRVYGADADGVYGRASGTTGTGVYGEIDAATTGIGVYGKAISTGSEGVRGIAEGNAGRGVYGRAFGEDAFAVYGRASGLGGRAFYGEANHLGGVGIEVEATGSSGIGIVARGAINGMAAKFYGNVALYSVADDALILQLGEGLDYAEGFDAAGPDEIPPGTVVSIDPATPGQLTVCSTPYDTKVAGIVAGANNLGSGVRLGAGKFDLDVALAGRVYCNVDATNQGIEPGDLLTTSPLPGHAMKATDHSRPRGPFSARLWRALSRGKSDKSWCW